MISYRYLALASLYVASLLSVGMVSGTKETSALKRLLSNDFNEIKEAQDEIVTSRKNLISGLINIIEQKENRMKKETSVRAAIFILGEMRAVEAVQVLVGHIGFPHVYEYTGEFIPVVAEGGMLQKGLKRIGKVYPAADALIKIGEPCQGHIIDKLSSADSVSEQKACLGVLIGLKTRDSVIHMLKDAINKETDTKKKNRLQSSLDLLKLMLKE